MYNKTSFINISKQREYKYNNFFKDKKLINQNTEITLNKDLLKNFYNNYIFYKTTCKYISTNAKKKKLSPYFLTLTIKQNIHSIPYVKHNIKLYRKALREMIREFQRKNEIMYVNIIEFNDNLFFHLHAIIYINSNLENKFIKIMENKIKLFNLGFKHFKKIKPKEFK